MARDTTVQFRVDSTVKEEAFAVFQKMGISPSEAVRVFLKQVQITQTLPFPVVAAEASGTDMDTDTDTDTEDDYTEWLRTRLAAAIKQLDCGETKSYSTEVSKTMLRERLAARRSALAATASSAR